MRTTTVQQPAVKRQASPWIFGRRRARISAISSPCCSLAGGVLMALPFLWMLSSSLKSISEIYVLPPTFIPESIQWTNYLEIWRRLPFHLFFRNSFLWRP